MAVTADEVRWIAHLARLELTADEAARFQRDLSAIVDYVHLLAEADVAGVEPLAHALDLANVFRDDILVPSLPPDETLANSPKRSDDFHAVPAVLD